MYSRELLGESTAPRIKFLDISDLHFYHPRNPTLAMIKHYTELFHDFRDDTELADLDLIIISGDLYDRVIEANSNDFFEAVWWLTRLVEFCERNEIRLRILEGTPSHDMRQSRMLEIVTRLKVLKGDHVWVKDLSIEHFEDLQLDILYVPDEWSISTKETLRQVRVLLKKHNLKQVDLAIMHGMFKFQLDGIPGDHDCHDEDAYHEIVRHYILIGHDHSFATKGRIIVPGSLDRNGHGEEEPKGGVICNIRGPEGDHFKFIENKSATIFKTIVLGNRPVEETIRYVDAEIAKLPTDSHVRLSIQKESPIAIAFTDITKRYPLYHITKLIGKEKPSKSMIAGQTISVEEMKRYTTAEVTRDNVVSIVMNEVDTLEDLSPDRKKRLETMLKSIRPT